MSDVLETLWVVLDALKGLKLHPQKTEYPLQDTIASTLHNAGVPFSREVVIGDGCRIDFLCDGGVGIEVKPGVPNSTAVRAQVDRYCRCDPITALVLVVERHMIGAPLESRGKPVHYLGLSKNWGITT